MLFNKEMGYFCCNDHSDRGSVNDRGGCEEIVVEMMVIMKAG